MALSLAAPLLSACSSGGELPRVVPDNGPPSDVDPDQIQLPFLVDDYFVPNGCFGDANCRGDVLSVDDRGCSELPAGVQGSCRTYTYTPLPESASGYQGFVGVLFQDVGPDGESEIGRVPGLPVAPGAKRVVFWAKVGSGSVDVTFRAGGANNWEGATDDSLPYKDDFAAPARATLTKDFQQISIDLSHARYTDVVSPFGWAIESDGITGPVVLFIADPRWE